MGVQKFFFLSFSNFVLRNFFDFWVKIFGFLLTVKSYVKAHAGSFALKISSIRRLWAEILTKMYTSPGFYAKSETQSHFWSTETPF